MLLFSETICRRIASSVFSCPLFLETGLFHELNRPGPSRLRVSLRLRYAFSLFPELLSKIPQRHTHLF